jgi:MYXO-CTERM domain-containing protein
MRISARSIHPSIAAAAMTLVIALSAGVPTSALAQTPDAENDFLATYAGPRNADLDVQSVRFTYDGLETFALESTSFGTIGTTPGAAFVWGINRGDGRADFARLGLPDIRFDFLAALVPDGTSFYVDLVTGQQGVLAPDAVSFAGTFLRATLPAGLLSSQGLAPTAYTANLWPRSRAVFDDDVISDFAPDNDNIAVHVTPEPGTWALSGTGLLLLGALARHRRRESRQTER